ncbi:B12-binding domain-containing radical SAM protein [candidate division KSB1 bacterium]
MRCLLVNPWIYDFAAFDLWIKPLGLLYIAAVLRDQGWKIELVDCLDRSHPYYDSLQKKQFKHYSTGKYARETINKPAAVEDIPRFYSRYGLPAEIVRHELKASEPPDLIFLTSGMTYWYPALIDMVSLIREFYESTPIILGGIYATLMPDHALRNIPVDQVFTGEAENRLSEIPSLESIETRYEELDDLPYPAFDLYRELKFLPILTSRGCPLKCSFCASHKISGPFRMRSVDAVVDEITESCSKYNVQDVAFYDDALLYKKSKHLLPILESVLLKNLAIRFHTPNGLQANEIDGETAKLLVCAGFTTIRLSLESVDEKIRKRMNLKVSPEGIVRAVESLAAAGFPKHKIETYILMGLPGQTVEDVIETLYFAAELKIISKPAAFSPIPGTPDWTLAAEIGDLNSEIDLLETNNSVYITRTKTFGNKIAQQIKDLAVELNKCNREDKALPDKESVLREIRGK